MNEIQINVLQVVRIKDTPDGQVDLDHLTSELKVKRNYDHQNILMRPVNRLFVIIKQMEKKYKKKKSESAY